MNVSRRQSRSSQDRKPSPLALASVAWPSSRLCNVTGWPRYARQGEEFRTAAHRERQTGAPREGLMMRKLSESIWH